MYVEREKVDWWMDGCLQMKHKDDQVQKLKVIPDQHDNTPFICNVVFICQIPRSIVKKQKTSDMELH